jgi:hypothetical protein
MSEARAERAPRAVSHQLSAISPGHHGLVVADATAVNDSAKRSQPERVVDPRAVFFVE